MRQILYGILTLAVLSLACCQTEDANFSIEEITYQIQASQASQETVKPNEVISCTEGEQLSLKTLTFTTTTDRGGIWAEAYLHDSQIKGESGMKYKDGLFTYGKDTISKGSNTLTFKPGAWTLQKNYDRFVIALVHQYGKKDSDYKTVARISINLSCQ